LFAGCDYKIEDFKNQDLQTQDSKKKSGFGKDGAVQWLQSSEVITFVPNFELDPPTKFWV
jgi:hypothetical protein